MVTLRSVNDVKREQAKQQKEQIAQRQYGLRETENTIVLWGDSITNQNIVAGHYSDRGFFVWLNALMGQAFTILNIAGRSGFRSDQILPFIKQDVLDYKPTYCLVFPLQNDINQGRTADQAFANVKLMYDQLIANNIRPIGSTITPSSVGQNTDAKRAEYHKLNKLLKDYARNNPGLILVDMGSVYIQPTAVAAITGHTVDETHPSAIGAYKMAKKASNVLKPHVLPVPSTLNYTNSDPNNIVKNGAMFGNAGTITNGTGATATGVVPDGWVLGCYGANTTAVASKSPKTNGFPGEDLIIEVTASAATTHMTLYTERQPSDGFAVGDKVYAQFEFEIIEGATIGQSITVGVDQRKNGDATPVKGQNYALFHESAAPNLAIAPSGNLIVKTPVFTVAIGVDRLRLIWDAYLLSGKARIIAAEIRKV